MTESWKITEACNGCTACARQCPAGAVEGDKRALHRIDPRRCFGCGVCAMACPKGAVVDPDGVVHPRVARRLRPRPHFDPWRCNGCGLCAWACAFDCIEIVGRLFDGVALLVNALACVGCRECEEACAKGAVQMARMDLRAYDSEARRLELEQLLAGEVEEGA